MVEAIALPLCRVKRIAMSHRCHPDTRPCIHRVILRRNIVKTNPARALKQVIVQMYVPQIIYVTAIRKSVSIIFISYWAEPDSNRHSDYSQHHTGRAKRVYVDVQLSFDSILCYLSSFRIIRRVGLRVLVCLTLRRYPLVSLRDSCRAHLPIYLSVFLFGYCDSIAFFDDVLTMYF